MSLEHDGGFIIDHFFDKLFGREVRFEYENKHGFDGQLQLNRNGRAVEDF